MPVSGTKEQNSEELATFKSPVVQTEKKLKFRVIFFIMNNL
jgi:hypothetical protein